MIVAGGEPIVVISGPTASGKTAVAVALAESLGAELVGADSVQIVREFDIGSSKPTARELRGVRHHLIDAVAPRDAIDAMDYARLADRVIADATSRGRRCIVVGGTGLWLRALVRGLVDLPAVDPAIRARLEAEVAASSAPAMHARLAAVDPLAAERIHRNDALRIVRALEVFEQTGRPVGELRAAHALGADRRPTLYLALDPSLEALTPRIHARVDDMVARGFADEVRGLLERHGPDLRALGSVGYRAMVAHVRGEADLTSTVEAIKASTRTYARRQKNWCRAEQGVVRLPPATSTGYETSTEFASLRDRVARHLDA